MAGPVRSIAKAMRLLAEQGPARGYYPEPAKSIFLCRPQDDDAARRILAEFAFRHLDGHRYVGGFIGTAARRDEWLAPQIQQWVSGVHQLAKVARRYPQTAYAGLVRSLQTEWTYLQRVVPGADAAFQPIEEALQGAFLPALFALPQTETDMLRPQSKLPVRFSGLGIADPTSTGQEGYDASVTMTEALARSLLQLQPLDATEHSNAAREATRLAHASRTAAHTSAMAALQSEADPTDARRIGRAAETGAWLTAMPDSLNGTDLTREGFRDSLRLRHGLLPSHLPDRCDACKARFTVGHALTCTHGGLILQRHEDVAGEWHALCAQAMTPSAVSDEPLIPTDQDAEDVIPAAGANPPHGSLPPALRGDVAVHGFWRRGTTAIFDVRVTDTDAAYHRHRDPAKILARHESEKKKKYGPRCTAAHLHFTPLVYSVDGMEGAEAGAARKRLASRLAAKWGRSYSQLCGFVRSRLAIALVRATSRCLRGTRDTSIRRGQSLDWVANTGLRLYQA